MKKISLSSFLTFFLFAFIFIAESAASTVTLKVNFEGTPPAAETIKMDADPKCKMMHSEAFTSDEVVVNADGTLKNVFVYVKEGLQGKFEAPKDAVIFDQTGCHYTPKVFGVMAGQPVEIRNSDDTLHNVHALPANSPQFNLGMPIKGMKLKKTFAKPEIMVKIKCEVHPWMKAYVGVVDNPYYGTTGDDGKVALKDLPAGEYTLEIWHEKYGIQTQKVTVSDQDQEIAVSYKA